MKKLLYTYITILILLAVLPINGTNSLLNNNYLLNIRWDYLAHAIVYIPLVPLAHRSLGKGGTVRRRFGVGGNINFKSLMILIISLLFAMSLEGIQYFLSYRAFNINDLVANAVGVTLGLLIYLLLPVEQLLLK